VSHVGEEVALVLPRAGTSEDTAGGVDVVCRGGTVTRDYFYE
jgi:hypothetical protein